LQANVWKGRFNRCWLISMFIQHSLLSIEGVKIPSVDELMSSNPNLTIAEAINLQRKLYGAEVDWESRKIFVRFKGKRYNITDIVISLVNTHSFGDAIDELGADTRGFNFLGAVKEAQKEIISKIVKGELQPEE